MLLKAIVKSQKARVILNASVLKIERQEHNISLSVAGANGNKVITADTLICAIPQAALKHLFPQPRNQRLLASVAPVPLNRIYGRVLDTKWLSSSPIISTPSHIRQFIPINPNSGLAMVSYSDTQDAKFWYKNRKSGAERLINSTLVHDIGSSFPGVTDIHQYYWEAGVHVWRPGYDSDVLSKKILQIDGPKVPIFIVGEAYSTHQAWIEGALESVDRMMNILSPK